MKDTKRTRVLIFSVTYFPFVGGAEVAIQEITKRIPDFDFDIVTAKINKKLPNIEQQNNSTIFRLGRGSECDKYLYPFRAFLFATKRQSQQEYHMVWAMMATWAGLTALFFKLKFRQVKYLLTLQSGDADLFIWLRTWFWYPLYRMIYSQADHIQVISNWLAKRARRYGYTGVISLVPNGVDLDKFNIKNAAFLKKQLKKKLYLEDNASIIFTASRLVKKNNISNLINAFKILINKNQFQHQPVYLIIAGSGKLAGQLKKLVKTLGVQDKVLFLGHIDNQHLPPYYYLADVFVRPSLSEGQGISFIESMAAGVPPIATPIGGIVDFIEDHKTGLFCQANNPTDIAEKIELLLNNPDLYQNIAVNAKKISHQSYDWDNIALKMKYIFNQIRN